MGVVVPFPTRTPPPTPGTAPAGTARVPGRPATHKVTIRKTYTEHGTPYKWVAHCTCGWGCASWSWSRALEANRYDRWIEENGQPVGGTLIWALEHVSLLPEDTDGIYPQTATP